MTVFFAGPYALPQGFVHPPEGCFHWHGAEVCPNLGPMLGRVIIHCEIRSVPLGINGDRTFVQVEIFDRQLS